MGEKLKFGIFKDLKRRKGIKKILILVLVLASTLILILVTRFGKIKLPEAPSKNVTPERTYEISKVNEIFIYSDYYQPSQIRTKKGVRIIWINKDKEEHILVCLDVSRDNPLFDVPIPSGENFTWAFHLKGKYRFWDPKVGQEMEGTIILS